MTKLPEKDLLSGAKMPRTTTGEMKSALGRLRDYLAELFGDDSSDKETARKTLGIDLSVLANRMEMETVLSAKADKSELALLESDIARRGTPIGSVDYFATVTPPAGYLKADGSAVGRETYPELFAAIGTTFGEGDGETTFNLPDLINRFAQGSLSPGQKIEAGLPNITGNSDAAAYSRTDLQSTGCFSNSEEWVSSIQVIPKEGLNGGVVTRFSAEDSNPIYGASDTVQPPALTLLPCIKAFDAATNPGLIDITALANDVSDLSLYTDTKVDAAAAAHAAMPSASRVGLTLSTNPAVYTAPADGYFFSTAYMSTSTGFINFSNENNYMGSMAVGAANTAFKIYLPVKGGDIVSVNYSNLAAQTTLEFFYCEGSKP